MLVKVKVRRAQLKVRRCSKRVALSFRRGESVFPKSPISGKLLHFFPFPLPGFQYFVRSKGSLYGVSEQIVEGCCMRFLKFSYFDPHKNVKRSQYKAGTFRFSEHPVHGGLFSRAVFASILACHTTRIHTCLPKDRQES